MPEGGPSPPGATHRSTPAALGSFVGRDAELAALRALFAAGERLVTLLGPPGIGKTRLALELADAEGAAHDVVFCDLTETRSLEAVVATVASALDAPPASRRPGDVLASIARALSDRRATLLVLDNAEQVASDVAALAQHCVAATDAVRMLVTSRQRLGLAGEVVFDVAPLGLPPPGMRDGAALELLLDRIRRVRRDFAPSDDDLDVLAEIARRLDGIPLALELCAGRANLVPPREILTRLERRFELLVRRSGDREATLRGAIDWSWELLAPAEREALAQCSVFRGGFDLEAAEAIVRPSDAAAKVIDLLQYLRDRSLVFARPAGTDGDLRLGLYMSIRDYAAERLDASGTAQAVGLRHARHFATEGARWAARAETPAGAADLARLSLERDNLVGGARAALACAAATPDARTVALGCITALRPVVMMRGTFHDELEVLDRALALDAGSAHPSAPALQAQAYFTRATLRMLLGNHRSSAEDFERARVLAVEGRAPPLAIRSLTALATLQLYQGKHEQARASVALARELLRAAPDPCTAARMSITLAFCDVEAADYPSARTHVAEAIELMDRSGGVRERIVARQTLGIVEQGDGRLDAAERCLDEVVATARDAGSVLDEHAARISRAIVWQEQGRLEEAAAAFAISASALRGLDDRFQGLALAHLGGTLALLDRLEEAEQRLVEAEEVFQKIETPQLQKVLPLARGLLDIAWAARARAAGDPDRAQALLASARARELSVHDGERSVDVRVARRIFERALASADSDALLVVHAGGEWFLPPGEERVDCRKLKNVSRLLAALATRRRDAPGRALTAPALLALGWPGERVVAGAGKNRLHVALSTLRKLGLQGILLATEDGYMLDPDVPVRVVG